MSYYIIISPTLDFWSPNFCKKFTNLLKSATMIYTDQDFSQSDN